MRVFVTGVTGVLGRASVRTLLADGHEVRGVAQGVDKSRALAAIGATPVHVHLFDPDRLATPFAHPTPRSRDRRVNERLAHPAFEPAWVGAALSS